MAYTLITTILAMTISTMAVIAQPTDVSIWDRIEHPDLGIPAPDSNGQVLTKGLLQALRWDSLVAACKEVGDGCYTTISRDSLLTHYLYNHGLRTSVNIVDYKGVVLRYTITIESALRPPERYFDKATWFTYTHGILGPGSDSLRLAEEESDTVLTSYYKLLGVGTRDEYGWICEYSAVGMAPDQRKAVLDLIKLQRTDILRRLLHGPNVEGRVYAADALIYLDYLVQQQSDGLKGEEGRMLLKSDSIAIEMLRSSDAIVRTCGNEGSYRIYEMPIREVLSDSALAAIPGWYQALIESGY